MVRRILSTVLAFLLLLPEGICTCGGASACTDHPESSAEQPTRDCEHGLSNEATASRSTISTASHPCHAPASHQPSCRAVSPDPLFATQTSGGSKPSAFSFCMAAIASFDFGAILHAPPRTTSHPPAFPLSLAHCPLLI